MIETSKPNLSTNPNISTCKFGKRVFPEIYRNSSTLLFHSTMKSLIDIKFYYQNSETLIFDSKSQPEKKCSPHKFEKKDKDETVFRDKCFSDLSDTKIPLLEPKLGKRCFPEMSKTTCQDFKIKSGIKCFPKDSLQSSQSTFFNSLLNPAKSIYHTKLNMRENGIFVKNSKSVCVPVPSIQEIRKMHSS